MKNNRVVVVHSASGAFSRKVTPTGVTVVFVDSKVSLKPTSSNSRSMDLKPKEGHGNEHFRERPTRVG